MIKKFLETKRRVKEIKKAYKLSFENEEIIERIDHGDYRKENYNTLVNNSIEMLRIAVKYKDDFTNEQRISAFLAIGMYQENLL